MVARDAEAAEVDHLAALWHDAWRDAHAHIVPAELVRHRTLTDFRDRLRAALASVRVVGPAGAPDGFCIVRGNELHQLFVAARARGSGVAATLIADAEARLRGNGVRRAWLNCAIGNERAAKFYEKCGWRRRGTVVEKLETAQGRLALETWRYEKALTREAR